VTAFLGEILKRVVGRVKIVYDSNFVPSFEVNVFGAPEGFRVYGKQRMSQFSGVFVRGCNESSLFQEVL
jgi:hypothetical protein